jgi:hypothetical protein
MSKLKDMVVVVTGGMVETEGVHAAGFTKDEVRKQVSGLR